MASRERSTSKTRSNYNPINSTPLSMLGQPPSPTPHLQTFVHVVKLADYNKPTEYLKILAIPLAPDSLKVGRQNMPKATNKITDGFFDSRVLSRNHAELFVKNNKLYIKDLKSSNGTFINGAKLEPFKDYELKVGDKLDLGTTLESQVAHKKITCTVAEFNYLSLNDYRQEIGNFVQKDDIASKKVELFNSTVDALIFGELVDERQEDDSLMALMKEDDNKSVAEKSEYVSILNVRPSNNMQDIIRKLAVAVNNEYIEQQRLQQVSKFLKACNAQVARNTQLAKSAEAHSQESAEQLKLELATSQRQVTDQTVQLKDLSQTIDQLETQLAAAESACAKQAQRVLELEESHRSLQAKVDALTTKADSYEAQLNESKEAQTSLSTELEKKSVALVDESVSTDTKRPPSKLLLHLTLLVVVLAILITRYGDLPKLEQAVASIKTRYNLY